jgi:hypothetical protein
VQLVCAALTLIAVAAILLRSPSLEHLGSES